MSQQFGGPSDLPPRPTRWRRKASRLLRNLISPRHKPSAPIVGRETKLIWNDSFHQQGRSQVRITIKIQALDPPLVDKTSALRFSEACVAVVPMKWGSAFTTPCLDPSVLPLWYQLYP